MSSSAETFESLKRSLNTTTGPWDRLPLLIELATSPDFEEPDFARQCAIEALNLARRLNDPFWTAHSTFAVGISLVRTSRYSDILYYMRQASEMFEKLNDPLMKAKADFRTARTYVRMQKMQEAVPLLADALNTFRSLENHKWIGRTCIQLGAVYTSFGDHAEAIARYRRALDIFTKAGLEQEIGGVYGALGATYRQIEDDKSQQIYLFKALAHARKFGGKADRAVAASGIANMYIDRQQFAQAEPYIRESLELYRQIGSVANQALAISKLSVLYRDKAHFAEAFRCYREAIALCKTCDDKLALGKLYETLGVLCFKSGRPRHCLTYFLKAFDLLEEYGDPFYLHQIHRLLGHIYEELEEKEKALYHYKQFARIRDDYAGLKKCVETGKSEREKEIREALQRIDREESRNAELQEQIGDKEAGLVSLTLELVRADESGKNGRSGDADDLSSDTTPRPDNWDTFARQFHKVHHGFYAALLKRFPDLTPAEAKICSLIRTGLSSREIAGILGIAKRTVDNHRMRILKRMDLPKGTSLSDFIVTM